jgi:hypothetical protein
VKGVSIGRVILIVTFWSIVGTAVGAGRPVILTVRCGTIDETFPGEQLRGLGATGR